MRSALQLEKHYPQKLNDRRLSQCRVCFELTRIDEAMRGRDELTSGVNRQGLNVRALGCNRIAESLAIARNSFV